MSGILKLLKNSLVALLAIASVNVATLSVAEAGLLRKYIIGKTLVSVEKKWAKKAAAEAVQRKIAAKLARNFSKEMISPKATKPGFKAFAPKDLATLEGKIANRSASKSEIKRLSSDERFAARRKAGVDRFWSQEADRIRAGQPGTREWSSKQAQDIARDARPNFQGKPLDGHHKYNARSYPQIADNPNNIYPATKAEHLNRWHGGNTTVPTQGLPRNPKFPEQF